MQAQPRGLLVVVHFPVVFAPLAGSEIVHADELEHAPDFSTEQFPV
jgi:hypothetical protein